jgi:hypothetical protein
MAVNDGQVLLFDLAIFPKAAQLAGGAVRFGDDGEAAGFAIEAIYQVWPSIFSEMEAHSANETRHLIGFGGMADQSRWFIDDQQFFVFMNDLEERAHIFFSP